MIFVEEINIGRQVGHEKLLCLTVCTAPFIKTVVCKEAFCVGIYNKDRLFKGIQKYTVRSFLADAFDRKQFLRNTISSNVL